MGAQSILNNPFGGAKIGGQANI